MNKKQTICGAVCFILLIAAVATIEHYWILSLIFTIGIAVVAKIGKLDNIEVDYDVH